MSFLSDGRRAGLSRTALGAAALGLALLVAGCERPPPESKQQGYRGLGMEQTTNPRIVGAKAEANQVPKPVDAADPGGQLASAAYKNVQVLGDLNENQFTRLMIAITEWVSPEQGCAYCHNPEDLSLDTVYAKVVARKMLQMTQKINAGWQSHVAATGVTCYTCHRGQPVPGNIWFQAPPAPLDGTSAANRNGQNAPSALVGLAALPNDPFTNLLAYANEVRVISTSPLPVGPPKSSTQSTEQTYGLMMHFSLSLGVNCTTCHNTRSFFDWDQSPPQRTTAWHGIRMVRELNTAYLEPLKGVFPPERLGALGDVPKVNCATCHQGVNKPLLGVSMLKDYPELQAIKP